MQQDYMFGKADYSKNKNGFFFVMKPFLLVVIVCMPITMFSLHAEEIKKTQERPVDPFDPNFCGGERIYPFIGINFASVCGPRNQVALGSKGKFSWFFLSPDGIQPDRRGEKLLSRAELSELTMLAEAIMLAEVPPPPGPERIIYNMGIEFYGKSLKGFFTSYTPRKTTANILYNKMMTFLPLGERPYLPECEIRIVFDPVLELAEKKELLQQLDQAKQNGHAEKNILQALEGNAYSVIGIK